MEKKMMTLNDIIEGVREENLTKSQLDSYYNHLISLQSSMNLRKAALDKEEARYWLRVKEAEKHNTVSVTNAEIEKRWSASEEGQEQIDLKYDLKSCGALISNIKHRIFSQM